MARIAPPGNRATVTDDFESLVVSIPTRKRLVLVVFLGFWLCGWTVGGALAIGAWLWNVAGVERIRFSNGEIRVWRGIGPLGLSREYETAHASGVRFSEQALGWGNPRAPLQFWGWGGGALVFDYGSSTVRFGAGLDEAEARQIAAQVVARFPALKAPR